MRVSVLGLGYVGCVSAACLAELGNTVIGLDVDERKLKPLREGKSPIVEPKLPELVKRGVDEGRLSVTDDYQSAVMNSEVSLVCVGTPSAEDGSPNLDYTRRVCHQIAAVIAGKDDFHTVVFRSTIPPGTVEDELLPIIEADSGKVEGRDFGVCFNPEFLREASAVKDFYKPPKIVIGERSPGSRAGDVVARLYESIDAPLARVDIKVSEMPSSFARLPISLAKQTLMAWKQLSAYLTISETLISVLTNGASMSLYNSSMTSPARLSGVRSPMTIFGGL